MPGVFEILFALLQNWHNHITFLFVVKSKWFNVCKCWALSKFSVSGREGNVFHSMINVSSFIVFHFPKYSLCYSQTGLFVFFKICPIFTCCHSPLLLLKSSLRFRVQLICSPNSWPSLILIIGSNFSHLCTFSQASSFPLLIPILAILNVLYVVCRFLSLFSSKLEGNREMQLKSSSWDPTEHRNRCIYLLKHREAMNF